MNTEGIKVRANNKEIGCLYELGNIEQDRKATKKKCINKGEAKIILDSIETGDISLKTEYDPTDTAGAGELESAFNSGADIAIEIELPDSAGNNGTTFKWEKAKITKFSIEPDADGEVGVEFIMAVGGKPTVIAAS